MSEELQDEVTSINSIYGDNTLISLPDSPSLYTLSFPAIPSISLRLEFPKDYPDAPPSVLGTQSVGSDVAKGEGTHLVGLARDVLAESYTPGTPCIFDLVEETNAKLQSLGLDHPATEPSADSQGVVERNDQLASTSEKASGEVENADDYLTKAARDMGLYEPPPWILSDVINEKKSIFVARAAHVTSVEQAQQYLSHLLQTDKKVAKATHNITAWRIRGENGVQFQDCDDDGETAAGGRVLHLLELMDIWDVMVVVSRWFGGVELGPDRFRFINQCARDAVVKGGFVLEGKKDGGSKKRGKK